MAQEEGLFEVGGNVYTLKLNYKKVKAIESLTGGSFVAEIAKSQGMLSFTMLEAVFAVGLHDTNTETAVKGKKAMDILESLLEDVGYTDVIQVTTAKIEEDLGFLFQGN